MYFNCPKYKQPGILCLVKHERGFVPILLILLILVLIFAGIYFFSASKGQNVLQTPGQNTTKQQEIVDYNSPLGFQFTYSKNLIAKEDNESKFNKRGNGDFRKNFTGYVQYEPGKLIGAVVVLDKTQTYDTNPLTLWVFDNPNDLSIDKWYANYWYYPFVWGDFTYTGKTALAPKQDATVSGEMGQSGVIDYQPGKPKFVYLSKDKKMYLFRIIGDNGDKILSTFVFTNQFSEGVFCGGIAGKACPDGYRCNLDGKYPDAGGKCI